MYKTNLLMEEAVAQAKIGMQKGEVPVGVAIFDSLEKKIISKAHNMVEELNNPLMHAEMIALNKAFRNKRSKYLNYCFIYVTLEPCKMCMDAILKSKIAKLYYSVSNTKKYCSCDSVDCIKEHNIEKNLNNGALFSKIEIYNGIMEFESSSLLSEFFYGIRNGVEFNFN